MNSVLLLCQPDYLLTLFELWMNVGVPVHKWITTCNWNKYTKMELFLFVGLIITGVWYV